MLQFGSDLGTGIKKRQNIEALRLAFHKGFVLDLIGIPVKPCRTLATKLETR